MKMKSVNGEAIGPLYKGMKRITWVRDGAVNKWQKKKTRYCICQPGGHYEMGTNT
jgi:hypothetical protein